MEVAVCPNCKKEIPEETKFCRHCSNPVVSVGRKQVFTWPWGDKIILFAVILIFIGFFQPWFPGSIILEDSPLSAYRMLINLNDLDIAFLENYNIMRMVLIVPILTLFLFIATYMRSNIQQSVFLPIFLLIIIFVSIVPPLYRFAGRLFGSILALILLVGIGFYFKDASRKGRLGKGILFILTIFFCASIFLYQLDLLREFYLKVDTLRLIDTYGFWSVWIMFTLLIVIVSLYSLKTVEDFWLLLGAVVLSLVGYQTFIHPLFLSSPFAFFADNLNVVGKHTITHIEVVFIAQVIAISTAVPIGVYITRNPTAADIVLYLTSIVITIPSIALFGFMMPVLSSIDRAWDAVSGIGIGKVPAILALALYSQLPIIRNTYIAIKNVDPSTIEAGVGMGMTRFQLLIQLQLPLAAPVIMAGVRTAVVMSIAIAAIAAYIGAGGLGLFVSEGLQMATNDSVIVGAISMGVLAILADIVFEKTEDWITQEGLKIERLTAIIPTGKRENTIMGIMLSLQEVTKIYPGAEHIKAVDSLSFDLQEGEICTVVGPSGCGKTTAMKMINRLIPMTSGKIEVDGQNINRMNTIELRRNIGYVIQNIGLFPNMTIAENIAIVPKMKKWDEGRIAEKVESLLNLINLSPEEFMGRYPRELSGGQQQRIGVARAMAADPPIMLMDEPFGAIDPINRDHLQNEFLKIQEKVKKTIVFVTHDIDEAIKMGDKICLLKAGKLVQFAAPEIMLTQPANDFVRDFVGGDRTLKRLNLLKIKSAMNPNPPTITKDDSPEKAKAMLSQLQVGHLIVVDKEKRLVGYVDPEALEKTSDTVGEVAQKTDAVLSVTSSLKDGLSEILTHDLGFIIAVDDERTVHGTLNEQDIKIVLRK